MIAIAVLLGACQLAEEPVEIDPPGDVDVSPEPAVDQFADGLARGEQTAAEWQEDAALAEVVVRPDDRSGWNRLELTYVAPDADRLLVVAIHGGAVSQQRPTLDTLSLRPLTPAAAADIPPLPEGVLPAQELVSRAGCQRVAQAVVYSSGAPTGWEGEEWSAPPAWTATILTSGDPISMDLRTGEGGRC